MSTAITRGITPPASAPAARSHESAGNPAQLLLILSRKTACARAPAPAARRLACPGRRRSNVRRLAGRGASSVVRRVRISPEGVVPTPRAKASPVRVWCSSGRRGGGQTEVTGGERRGGLRTLVMSSARSACTRHVGW